MGSPGRDPAVVEVANWMLEQARARNILAYAEAVQLVRRRLGYKFTHMGERGDMLLNKSVLGAFHSLAKGSVVWDRAKRQWQTLEASGET